MAKKSNTPNKFDASIYLEYVLKHWKWYILGVALALFVGLSYLRYASPEYVSKATVLVRSNEDNNLLIREIRGNLDMLSKERLSQAEATILQSRYLLNKVVKELGIYIKITSITGKTGLKHVEAYKDAPFKIVHPEGYDSLYYDASVIMTVTPIDVSHFELKAGNTSKKIAIGSTFKVNSLNFKLVVNKGYKTHWQGYKYQVSLSPIQKVVSSIQSNLSVDLEKSDAGILTISMKGSNTDKNTDIIRQLIKEHNIATIEERSRVAENTKEFVDERIALVEKELSFIERSGESIKSKNHVINLDIEYSHLLLRLNDIEKDIVNTGVQVNLVDYVSDYMHEEKDALIPANIGLASTPLFKSITHYNELYNEFERLQNSTGNENPAARKIKEELDLTRENVLQGMKSMKFSQKERMARLEAEEQRIHKKLGTLPSYETDVRGNNRLKQLKEATYVFLLQKKEENEIDLASTSGNLRLIDEPYAEVSPIYPNKRVVYVLIPVFGFLLPTLLLFLFDSLRRSVKSESDLQSTGADILGVIPRKERKNIDGYEKNERTEISESFRRLRFNLNHLFTGNENCKVVLVSSTRPNEGKTFIALNLARCISDTDKKVAVVGMDLRNPQLLNEIGFGLEQTGISNYINDPSIGVEEIILPSPNFDYLSFIPSGQIPENPAEILSKSRLNELIQELRERFDYIIIDSCSVEPMIDVFLLTKHANLLLYVARLKHLMKRDLSVMKHYMSDERLGQVKVVVNSAEPKRMTYEYAKENQKKNWFKELFQWFKKN